MSEHLEQEKAKILAAALPAIPFDGWSWKTLREAAVSSGYDEAMAQRAFPGGPGELLAFFQADIDARLEAVLAKQDLAAMKVRERIEHIVRTRLTLLTPYREVVRQSLSAQVRPGIARQARAGLRRTVDTMWWLAGDTSTDFNHYTKRAMLTGVYAATVLAWLDDDSEDFRKTWSFLHRRIGNIMTVQKLRGRLERELERLPTPWGVLRRLRRGRGEDAEAG